MLLKKKQGLCGQVSLGITELNEVTQVSNFNL